MNNDLRVHPKPKFGVSDDAEDEMLNYQELFHRSNLQPSAQVIREPKVKRQQSNEHDDNKRKSPIVDLTQTTVMQPVVFERDVSATPVQLPKPITDPFPQAKYRGSGEDLEKITLPNVKKASVFAKQMYRDGKLKTCKELQAAKEPSANEQISRSALLTGSGLGEVTGERELQRIHNENLERMQSMNEKEILEEKEKLLKTLDPNLIAFMRKRNKNEGEEMIRRNENPVAQRMDVDDRKETTTLPIETDSRWVHMDTVEREKLEWMKDLPAPAAQRTVDESNPEAVPARFDFKGNLMSRTVDIPVTAALHHHGEEPEAAGYTLEELFHLSRSTVLQQRMIALQTLANIIRKAHTGVYDLDLQLPLIPKLIEAGILFLIRWAMDEQIEAVFMVAIECLANLVAPRKDEEILSRTTHWPCGYYEPTLTPPDLQLGEKKSESDLTDLEILEQDVIKCLFRMNVLKRIVYLLDRMRLLPSLTVAIPVKNSFHILTRMARHSMTCANQIFEERQLMDFIIREFIPEMFVSSEDRIYEHLLPEALTFCRVLASHGSTLAFNLVTRYELPKRLRNHLVAAVNLSSSLQDNRTLVELLSLWRMFILQGHMADELGSLIPTIVLPLCRACIQQMPNMVISQILVQLVAVFDALIIYVTKFISKHRDSSEGLSNAINWSHIDGLFDIVLTIGKQTLIETDEEVDLDALRTVCLSCLASFLIGQQLLTINLLDLPVKVKRIRTQFFEPLLRLQTTKQLIENVKLETAASPTNSTTNLPTLTQMNVSPFGLLIALLRLTNIIYHIDKPLAVSSQLISHLMLTRNSEVVVYIKKMLNKLTSPTTRKVPWFEQFEHVFLFQFIQVIRQEKPDNDLPSIYYEILLSMLPSLLKGYHYLAQEALKLVLFDLSYWKRSNESDLADLSLITHESLHLASNESITLSSSQRTILYERAIEHLPSLYTYYKNVLHINRSSTDLTICDIHFGNAFQTDDLLRFNIHYSHALVDPTWPYGLLSSLYTNVLSIADNAQRLELILNTLRFVYILEMKHSIVLCKVLTRTTRFCMIAGIYLLGSDVFLEKSIADYLVAFLNCFNEQHLLQKIETRSHVQSLMTFFDFYRTLVDQYDACSFGDILYSNYLLVPLQQIYDVQLRKHVWIERATILKSLRLKPDQLLFSLEGLFLPYENDVDMILYYVQVLINGTIQRSGQPLLYMIAVHHLNAFVFDQTRPEQLSRQRTVLKTLQMVSSNDKILHDDVISYKTFSRDGPVIFSTLPSIRTNWLAKLVQ